MTYNTASHVMKILIPYITDAYKSKNSSHQLLMSSAEKKSQKIIDTLYENIWVKFYKNSYKIFIENRNIDDFDAVLLRTGNTLEFQYILANYCFNNQITMIDEEYCHKNVYYYGKAFSYCKLIENEIPIIPGYYISEKQVGNINLKFPVVVKCSTSHRGSKVKICSNFSQLKKTYKEFGETHLIIQPYIENDGYFRIIVVNNKITATIKRFRRKNQKLPAIKNEGARQVRSIGNEIKKIAKKAATAMNYKIAGIDIFANNDSAPLIIEINRSPQFTVATNVSDIDIAGQIIDYIKLVANK